MAEVKDPKKEKKKQTDYVKLTITYEIDGEIIKTIKREINQEEKWFWLGNSIWRGY